MENLTNNTLVEILSRVAAQQEADLSWANTVAVRDLYAVSINGSIDSLLFEQGDTGKCNFIGSASTTRLCTLVEANAVVKKAYAAPSNREYLDRASLVLIPMSELVERVKADVPAQLDTTLQAIAKAKAE
ncbi:hypothetical protein [Vibrio phage LV6]|nr:hypothetical protein [Vibrio phage LV6]